MLARSTDRKSRRLRGQRTGQRPPPAEISRPHWGEMIPLDQWEVYWRGLKAIRATHIPFVVGGGFAMASYTGRWRNTKDIDFYVIPDDREKAIQALTQAGFGDYYYTLPYDRGWIYRCIAGGVIVDIIWSMANRRAVVDTSWFDRAPSIEIHGETLEILPVEELLWTKIYVLQHDHCDWPDVINLLYAVGPKMDWEYLLERLGEDRLILKAVVTLLDWLCPGIAAIPEPVRNELGLPKWPGDGKARLERIKFLDSRRWFAALLPPEAPLEI